MELATKYSPNEVEGKWYGYWLEHKLFSSKLKSLILVPNKQLVEQFYKDLIDYGYDPHSVTRFTAGLRGKDAFDSDAKITIANR